MKPTSVAFTMPRLSQACLLGYTPSPQQAFQGDAAHQGQRRTWLTPNDSPGTWYTRRDYRSNWTLHPFHRTVFTAHTWSAIPDSALGLGTVAHPCEAGGEILEIRLQICCVHRLGHLIHAHGFMTFELLIPCP